jgi:copper chaperone
MKALLAVSLTLLVAACTKEGAGAGTPDKAAVPAAAPAPAQAQAQPGAVAFPEAVPAAPATPAVPATPTAATEGHTCGGACCGGEGEGGGGCGGACGGGGEAAETAIPADAPASAHWTTLTVQGMHCGGCAKRIMAALSHMDGVIAVQADHKSGQVRWAVAEGHPDLRDGVIAAIRKLGYRPQV